MDDIYSSERELKIRGMLHSIGSMGETVDSFVYSLFQYKIANFLYAFGLRSFILRLQNSAFPLASSFNGNFGLCKTGRI